MTLIKVEFCWKGSRVELRNRGWYTTAAAAGTLAVFNNNVNDNNYDCIERRKWRFFLVSSQSCQLCPTQMLKWPGHCQVCPAHMLKWPGSCQLCPTHICSSDQGAASYVQHTYAEVTRALPSVSNTHMLKWPGHNRVQYIGPASCATCRVPCVMKGQPAVKFNSLNHIYLTLFYWLKPLTNEGLKQGRKLEFPEKTPDDELQKMPHIKAWKFKPQRRLELAH